MLDITIPDHLLPHDGRFGSGPSKIRDEQLKFLASLQPRTAPLTGSSPHLTTEQRAWLLGTSHRQPPVKQLVERIRANLSELFRAPAGYEILLSNGGATSFWDAAVHSLIERRSQHLAFGEFGAKFAAAAANAPWLAQPDIREATPGSRSEPTPIPGIDVYAYPQNETSTGVMAPVARVFGDSGALTVVDATSGAGGIDFDANEVDIYYFSAQKNFGSDGGIWFALVSPEAIERIERINRINRYIPETLSLAAAVTNSRQNQTLNTPAVTTLALMAEQLHWINANGGLGWAATRTATSSALLYDWAERCPVARPFVANPAHRSPVVVTIDFADTINAATLASVLRANGILDTEPYRKLGRNQLRVATFTSVEADDVRALTACIDYVIERMEP